MTLLTWGIVSLFLGALGLTAYAGWRGAPFFPTPMRAVRAALDLADVGMTDVVMDIGAGDGRVVQVAAERGARAIGFELSPFLWLLGSLRLWMSHSRGRLRFADGFRVDVSSATVLFLFLTPRTMPAAVRHLASQLKPGTRILSYAFPVTAWTPTRTEKPPGAATVYLYTIPTIPSSETGTQLTREE